MKKILSILVCVCLLLSAMVFSASAAETASYVKVTEAPADWSGDYLIVYEDGANTRVLNGGLSTIDAEGNYITVAMADGVIEANATTNAAKFTIEKYDNGYSIKSASGLYMGNTKDQNKIITNATTKYENTLTLNADGSVDVVSAGSYLRSNIAATNGNRFRYYKSSSYTNQKAISLYKLETVAGTDPAPETPVDPDPTPDPEPTPTPDPTPDAPAATTNVTLTVDSLGLASNSYSAGTATVNGAAFEWIQLGNYGDGIQVRDKNDNTSLLWNTAAFGAAIKEIKLVYSSTKDVQYANANAEIFSFGNAVDSYAYSTKLSTQAGVKEYTITPDANTYTFFKFEHDVSYTFYWDSITIVLAGEVGDTTPDPETPVDPDPTPDPTPDPEVPENNDPAADSVLTIVEALALAETKEHNTYTENKYYVTGEVVSVYNTQYGNLYIKDADGNILTVYGTYDADGTNRYDAMETAPVAGDTITVYGIIGKYNTTLQMKNGWVTALIPGEGEPEVDNDPEADSTLTVEEAIALGSSKLHNIYTTNKYYVVGTITEVYETTYGNMRITDEAGNILTIYGSYDADGTNRYDAMENAPQVGDTVKLYGIIGQYNNVAQMKNAWIIEIVADDNNNDNNNDDTNNDNNNDDTNNDNDATEEKPGEKPEGDKSPVSPNTGDNMGAVAMVAIAAAAAIVASKKR